MNYISIEKIKKYSPDNEEFVLTSLQLLISEIEKFEKSIQKFEFENDIVAFKQAIHKIKPSFELFLLPSGLKGQLLDFYETKNDSIKPEQKTANIRYFTSQIEQIKAEINNLIFSFTKSQNV